MKKRKIKSSSKNNVNDIKNKESEPSVEADSTEPTPVVEAKANDYTATTPKKRGRKKKVTEPIKESDSLSVEDDIDYSKIKEPNNLKLTRARKAKNDE